MATINDNEKIENCNKSIIDYLKKWCILLMNKYLKIVLMVKAICEENPLFSID